MLTADAPNLQGGSRATELVNLNPGERVLAVTSLGESTYGWAFGTARGVVKRTNPELLSNKDAWELIRLDEGDAVVGAVELTNEAGELCFISADAQLLHFPVASVRPQGRTGGGMAGIKLASGDAVVWFGLSPMTTRRSSPSRVQNGAAGTGPGSSGDRWSESREGPRRRRPLSSVPQGRDSTAGRVDRLASGDRRRAERNPDRVQHHP